MGFSYKQREMALSAKMWARGKGRGVAPEPPHATQSPPEFRGARRRSALTRNCRAQWIGTEGRAAARGFSPAAAARHPKFGIPGGGLAHFHGV